MIKQRSLLRREWFLQRAVVLWLTVMISGTSGIILYRVDVRDLLGILPSPTLFWPNNFPFVWLFLTLVYSLLLIPSMMPDLIFGLRYIVISTHSRIRGLVTKFIFAAAIALIGDTLMGVILNLAHYASFQVILVGLGLIWLVQQVIFNLIMLFAVNRQPLLGFIMAISLLIISLPFNAPYSLVSLGMQVRLTHNQVLVQAAIGLLLMVIVGLASGACLIYRHTDILALEENS